MDGFRFILENPHPNASNNKQRKRARLVTACDSCRVKKIKCQQSSPNARCDACKTAKTPCLFGDRDRYQAERGVTCTWNPPPVEEAPASPEGTSRKRKMTSPESASRKHKMPSPLLSSVPADHWISSASAQSSRAATPANYLIPNPNYQYSHPESQSELDMFPQNTVPSHDGRSISPSDHSLPLFDPARPRYPHPQRMHHLGVLFFDNIGSHFPFLDRYDVLHRIEQRTCSPILSNCIAGLAARFADPDHSDLAASATFYDMAKSLATYVVGVPSVEALHALICITWAEYGAGNDSGFWTYSRMAITMCLDLGLGNEATIQVAATPEVRLRLRLTWWTVVCVADISVSWATGHPTVLDLDSFDTALPQVTDDASLMLRNSIELLILRGRINRFLDARREKRDDSAFQWDLSYLQRDLQAVSHGLTPSLRFTKENLVRMHERRLGHVFVGMHFLIHAVGILANLPSLLHSYGLPAPTEGTHMEAARSSARAIVDILIVVEEFAPQALRDPFLDLPLLVASRVFLAKPTAQPGTLMAASPQSSMVANQWSDTFLSKCKDGLVRISSACGGVASFDSVLERHGGTFGHESQAGQASSADLFTVPQNAHWLLRPGLMDDTASDTSSSFRSSSRELSPRIVSTKRASSSLGASPLVRPADDHRLHHLDMSFRSSEIFEPGALGPEGGMFLTNFLDEPCAIAFSLENPSQSSLLPVDDTYLPKDSNEATKLSSSNALFPPLQW